MAKIEVWWTVRSVSWGSPKPVQVTGETEHFITLLSGRREKKNTQWHRHFRSREDAYNWLIEKNEDRVDSLSRQVEKTKIRIHDLKEERDAGRSA